MSTDLTINNDLDSSAQYVEDQTGNTSSLALTKDGNVGIGKTNLEHNLDVNGTVGVKSSALGQGIFFVNTEYSLGDYYSEGNGSYKFRLQRNIGSSDRQRIFEVWLSNSNEKGDFFFDHVDVYPDKDNSLSLGRNQNRWSELHVVDACFSGSLNVSNLTTPPPGLNTVDLVMDPATGKIYRKA